jgi:hypothetical protein
MMLGGSGSLAEPFPLRPKGMHRRRYSRLFLRAEKLETVFFSRFLSVLGGSDFKFD